MRTWLIIALLSMLLSPVLSAATSPPWNEALIKLERWPANAGSAQVSAAFSVAPGLLATILVKPANSDSYRAVSQAGTFALKLLARDIDSGFSLLAPANGDTVSWPVVPIDAAHPALLPGASLTVQSSSSPMPARLAGRDLLHRSRLLESPWLRVHLPQGSWALGTPLTNPDGTLAGMLAGEVTDVTEAGRVLPAAAVAHFLKLWNQNKTLARAVLGLKLSPAAGIPRVEECVADLPAERNGLQPGDVLLRIGTLTVHDAAAAAEACFYLRVDEPVTITVLRGTETRDLTMTPVSAASRQPDRR
ncbi:MAG TPA: PDZ domain-containing protein [Verrucomicrobiales bacterium]|jgi:hypothetical protein|nr:PDZ domain-containing protein [Verrucomicrobiales bacterium]